MAADRQRLAQALAAEAARRKMFESIPEAAGQGLPQAPERPMGWNDYLENLSIGLGRGAVNNLEGIKGMVTSPVESLKGVATGVAEAVRNPRMVAEALKQTGQRAMSGPLGLGEVIGENVNMMRVPGKPVMHELDVYHGTPHRFPATEANPLGEFDASKIGTGEGAQAYGHGIYLAEKPDIAKGYQKRLAGSSYIDSATQTQKQSGDLWTEARNAVQNAGQAHPDRAGEIASQVQDWVDSGRSAKTFLKHRAVPKNLEPAYQAAMNAFGGAKQNTGALYKADLPDEMIDRMLDWDKPLSKDAPQAVKDAFNKLAQDYPELKDKLFAAYREGKPGSHYYSLLNDYAKTGDLVKNQLFASNAMRQAGIPGIRYLDAGSRGQGGSGTRNFVVFPGEEKKVRILERDGQKAPPQKIAQALEATAQKTTAVEVPDVLHGSPMRKLANLSPSKSMEVRGATWFSDNPDVAEQYTFPREYGEILYDAEPGEIYKAGLSFKNPMTVDMEGKVGDAMELSKLVKKAKEEGYDGLILRNVDDSVDSSKLLGTSYAVFDQSQIKLKKK